MATKNNEYLKRLLQDIVPETVMLASFLMQMNISRDLQQYYKKSGWIKPIGTGAFIRAHDKPQWQGGIYALQTQASLPIHPGGLTALSLQGFSHYLRFDEERIHIFTSYSKIPKWFRSYDWGNAIEYYSTSFLPSNLASIKYEFKNFSINISSPERAMLECLYLTPNKMDIIECYQVMEGLVNLRPVIIQELLEQCKSIKVKRLFLYMADKQKQSWFKYIDKAKIDLGSGDRSLVKDGVYIKDYKITVPRQLAKL
jgi:hypothetical protein